MNKKGIPFKNIYLLILAAAGLSCVWHTGFSVFIVECRIISLSMQILSCSMWDLVP